MARAAIACGDGAPQPGFQHGEGFAEHGLQRRDAGEPDEAFFCIMQQRQASHIPRRIAGGSDFGDRQAVPGHRQRPRPAGMATPAPGARQTHGEVLIRPAGRIRIGKIDAVAAGQQHEGAAVVGRSGWGCLRQRRPSGDSYAVNWRRRSADCASWSGREAGPQRAFPDHRCRFCRRFLLGVRNWPQR